MPKSQPSIGATLAAIAREAQIRRDQNLMDAWKSGGMFEGEKATDELVLAHWRERLAGVAKNDPLYDTYKNAVTQYEYAIAESKIATRYAQGKVDDREMAAFYINWSKRVPRDSEFYRVLQRDAAQFMRAAKAKAKAAAAEAAEQTYQQAQAKTERTKERPGQYLTDVMRTVAQAHGLIGMGDSADLTNFDPGDPEAMMRLFNELSGTGWYSGGQGGVDTSRTLYTDPISRKAVTAGDIAARLKGLDPSFDGRLTMDYLRSALTSQRAGIDERLKRAQDTGHATDANNLRGWQTYVTEVGRQTNAWPAQTTYTHYRQDFLSTWMNPTATPQEKVDAWNAYAGRLTGLAAAPGLDDNTRSRILAEVNGDTSVESLAESFAGLGGADNTTTAGANKGDIAETWFDLQRYAAQVEAVNAGGYYWTTGIEQDGIFEPRAGGPMIGAATYEQIVNVSPVTPAVVMVPQGAGQKPAAVLVTGVGVDATAKNALGEAVPVTNRTPLASVYDVTIGGARTRVYGFTAADGKTYYSTDKPWGDGVRAHEDGSGIHLDLSPLIPTQDAKTKEWVYADGSPADVSGANGIGLSEPNREGERHLVIDPVRAGLLTDPARARAGVDPATDFFSPTLAALMTTPEGMKSLARLRDDPQFKAQLEWDAYRAAGFAQDAKTGAWVGGDQALLDQFNRQVFSATHVPDGAQAMTGFVRDSFALWGRLTHGDTFDYGTKSQAQGPAPLPGASSTLAWQTQGQLPSDAARGTGFDALARVWQVGSNLIKQLTGGSSGTTIKTAGSLTLPSVPQVSIAPPPTTIGPTPAPGPGQTTSVATTVPYFPPPAPAPSPRPGNRPV